MVKEIYVSPEIEAILFDSEDIITTSVELTASYDDEIKVKPW